MPRSYRCDYCDRTFAFSRENVRKHNLSKQHLRLKEDYYKQFEIVEANGSKTIGEHVDEWLQERWPLSKHLNSNKTTLPPSLIAEDLSDSSSWGW